jgi:hypothetical protein
MSLIYSIRASEAFRGLRTVPEPVIPETGASGPASFWLVCWLLCVAISLSSLSLFALYLHPRHSNFAARDLEAFQGIRTYLSEVTPFSTFCVLDVAEPRYLDSSIRENGLVHFSLKTVLLFADQLVCLVCHTITLSQTTLSAIKRV